MNEDSVTHVDLKSVTQPLWVYGLRTPSRPSDVEEEESRWRLTVALVILDQFEKVDQGEKTMETEAGLGIPPSWYWFVSQANTYFGNGVFFFLVETEGWSDNDRGVCPFDTGGLWHNKISTYPPIDPSDKDSKRTLFARYDRRLKLWDVSFKDYVYQNYYRVTEYIEGKAPTKGSGVAEIVKGPPNSSFAWTWEGRVERVNIAEKAKIVKLYCQEQAKSAFLNWLEEERVHFGLPQKKSITAWIQRNCTPCGFGESPAEIATRALINPVIGA